MTIDIMRNLDLVSKNEEKLKETRSGKELWAIARDLVLTQNREKNFAVQILSIGREVRKKKMADLEASVEAESSHHITTEESTESNV